MDPSPPLSRTRLTLRRTRDCRSAGTRGRKEYRGAESRRLRQPGELRSASAVLGACVQAFQGPARVFSDNGIFMAREMFEWPSEPRQTAVAHRHRYVPKEPGIFWPSHRTALE